MNFIIDERNTKTEANLPTGGSDQMNNMSYKVLHSCNIWKNKNKNNNTMLKSGDGKLMMTNGISITEFTKKYHL